MNISTLINEDHFEGWDRYPLNLPNSQHLSFAYDLERYRQQILDDTKCLFIPQNKETTLKVIEFGREREHLQPSELAALVTLL